MKPIPRKLLLHNAKLLKTDAGRYGEEVIKEEIILQRVRIEPSSALALGKENRQIKLSAKLFFDCKNSSPVCKFDNYDKIEWDGDRYNIAFIQPFYDDTNLHHYELGLAL